MPGPMGPSRTVNGKSPASSPPTRPKNWFKYWTTRSSVRDSYLPGSLRELPSHDTGWRRSRGAVERAAVAGPTARRAGPSTYRGSRSSLAGLDVAVRYLFQRLVQGLLVLLRVTTIIFALTFVAGDPASTLAPLDTAPRFFAFLGQSIPVFLLGMVLILVFAVGLRWLPSSGGESWKSLILPAISIGSFSAAVLARLLRSSLLEVLSQEYIRTAYAK